MSEVRLIDANALRERFEEMEGEMEYCAWLAREMIDDAPTIDPVRHARWVEIPIESDAVEYADYVGFLAKTEMNTVFWECSACGSFDRGASSRPPKFCRGVAHAWTRWLFPKWK